MASRPWRRSFLGFTLRNEPELRRCIADKAIVRFKHRVRELTGRHRGITLEQMIREPVPYGLILSALEKAGKSLRGLTVEELARIDHFRAGLSRYGRACQASVVILIALTARYWSCRWPTY